MDRQSVLGQVVRHFRSGWKQLMLTDLVYKLVAFVVLTPLVGVLFRVLLAAAGKTVLADQDILFFFLGPVGWLCGITVGGLWLAIVALEQAALMAVLCANQKQRHIALVDAVQFAGANAWPVLRVTARMVGITLLTTAPFLVAAAVVYVTLLGEFDINYYLKEKPPAFLVALGIGGVLAVVLVVVLLRLFSGWLFALPLVLFEDVRPSGALRSQFATGTRPSPQAPAVDRRLGLGINGVIRRGDVHRRRSRAIRRASSHGENRCVGPRDRHRPDYLGRSELGGESVEHDQLRRRRVQSVPSARPRG